MKLIKDQIRIEELVKMADESFGDFVKAVVDVEKEMMVVDAPMHADEEKMLLEKGSKQENLWGINLFPENEEKSWIEFDSMINLRPSFGNSSRGVENKEIQVKIVKIVNRLVKR